MKTTTCLLALLVATFSTAVQADSATERSEPHLYLGVGITSLALDNTRVPFVPTSSPGHAPKIGSLRLGYQFNDLWAAELSAGTDISDNVDTDTLAVNGYRFLGAGDWRPFLSVGLSNFEVDGATDDSTQQIQAGFGLSGNLTRNVEFRIGYQYVTNIDDENYQDHAYTTMLAWHFREPEAVVATLPEPTPKPELQPQPTVVPEGKEPIQTYRLRVLFDFDKAIIKEAYEPQFQEIARVLSENPEVDLLVEGHTCWIGTEQYNQGLSERRAGAVKEKFVQEYGIDPVRIETVGYGETQPVAANTTQAGREKNRRAIAVTLSPENIRQQNTQ